MSLDTLLIIKLDAYISAYQRQHNTNPSTFIDPDSPSPAQIEGTQEGEHVQWQVYKRTDKANLDQLAKALEVDFPAQLHTYFCSLYSGNLMARYDGHELELLLPWNEDDFVRLQQNITGHVLMKRRLKQQDTVFIGLTEQDDLLVSVRLSDGAVCLEYVGKEPHHTLAHSLADFIEQLEVN